MWDLLIGLISGVISGLLVFWLLSRRTPHIQIIEITQTDRVRIQVKNTRRDGLVLKGPAASAVQNFAELSPRHRSQQKSDRITFANPVTCG